LIDLGLHEIQLGEAYCLTAVMQLQHIGSDVTTYHEARAYHASRTAFAPAVKDHAKQLLAIRQNVISSVK